MTMFAEPTNRTQSRLLGCLVVKNPTRTEGPVRVLGTEQPNRRTAIKEFQEGYVAYNRRMYEVCSVQYT